MDIPNNCWECPHSQTCDNTYYGGSMCKYKCEIYHKAVDVNE